MLLADELMSSFSPIDQWSLFSVNVCFGITFGKNEVVYQVLLLMAQLQ
jgi:hypothetical protein